MVDRTSTGTAPWTIVESNDKYFARVKVLRTICERLEKELKIDLAKEPRTVITRDAKDTPAKDSSAKEASRATIAQPRPSKAQLAKDLRAEKARAAKEAKARKESARAGKVSARASHPA
jgi:hypothetical protein